MESLSSWDAGIRKHLAGCWCEDWKVYSILGFLALDLLMCTRNTFLSSESWLLYVPNGDDIDDKDDPSLNTSWLSSSASESDNATGGGVIKPWNKMMKYKRHIHKYIHKYIDRYMRQVEKTLQYDDNGKTIFIQQIETLFTSVSRKAV